LLGHIVRTVDNGLAAIDSAADFGPHFIVLDIAVPGLDRYQAAKQIRQHR